MLFASSTTTSRRVLPRPELADWWNRLRLIMMLRSKRLPQAEHRWSRSRARLGRLGRTELAVLRQIRAAGGFADEDPADLREAENALHKLAISEKRRSLQRHLRPA